MKDFVPQLKNKYQGTDPKTCQSVYSNHCIKSCSWDWTIRLFVYTAVIYVILAI